MSQRPAAAWSAACLAVGVAACGGVQGFVRPLVGGHVVAVPPAPIVEDYVSRGEFEGGGFHADVSAGVAYWRVELGMGMRVYTGFDYEGRCPRQWRPDTFPPCQDRVVSRDALWRAAATGVAGGALESAWNFPWRDWWQRRRLRRLR